MFQNLLMYLAILNCVIHCLPLIVPQELPSIFSLIYSSVPQLKKGTDSRLGFGFRLGEHADFQVLLELGPQKKTQPLGNDDSSFTSKRHIAQKEISASKNLEKLSKPESAANGSLQTWVKNMVEVRSHIKPNAGRRNLAVIKNQHHEMSVVAAPIISNEALQQLQLLQRMTATITKQATKQIPDHNITVLKTSDSMISTSK